MAYLDGRLQDFERIIAERIDVMRWARHHQPFVYWFVNTLPLKREQGTIAELPALVAGWRNTPRPTVPSMVNRVWGAFVAVLAGEQPSVSLEDFHPGQFPDDDRRSGLVAATAEIAAAVGDDRFVRQALRSVEGFEGMHLVARSGYLGPYDRFVGLLRDRLDDHDPADEAFARAIQATESFRTPVWVARTELDWAESLLRRDLRDAAAAHVGAARAAIGDLALTDSRNRADRLDARLA